MKIRNGQPCILLVFLIAIFIIGLAYIILMNPMGYTYNKYYNDTDPNDTEIQTFYTRSKTIWDWLLLPCAIALIIWAIIKIKKKSQYDGLGG